MKKLLSMILAALLAFSCLTGFAAPRAGGPVSPRAEGLTLSASELTLPMYSVNFGERLRVYYDGESVPASYFSWSSSDTGVVTVNGQGYLTAVAPGSAVITVSDDTGSAQCSVTVVNDDDYTRINELDHTTLALPYSSGEVGIGPLCGAQPVILKRFINPPSCSCDPPDPNELIPEEGWIYTYAVLYRVHASYGQSIRFVTAPSNSDGPHATGAYITLYDQFFNIWSFNSGTNSNPFGSLTLDSYEYGDFYVAITPISHTADGGSGNISLTVYDVDHPFVAGETDLELWPQSMTIPVFSNESGERLRAYVNGEYTLAGNFTWQSSDTSVVAADEDGYIWAAAPGTATVTATATDGTVAQSVITVVPDEVFTTVDRLEFTDVPIDYIDPQVGIGPLYGATPVILQRERPSPVCPAKAGEPLYDADDGWAYTYAVGYHISVPAGRTLSFITSAYDGAQANDVNTFITIFDSNFENTGFKFNYDSNPYASMTYEFDQGGDFYVVITPLNYNVVPGNGYIRFEIADISSPNVLPGDVDADGQLTFTDVSSLYMFLIGVTMLDPAGMANADFDGSGAVDFTDISMLYTYLI